jgi:hypothetical protein
MDPYNQGCNLHTALLEWYDCDRIREAENQRRALRCVSRSWKALVDLRFDLYFEALTVDDLILGKARWRSAARIHLGVTQGTCYCTTSCLCYQYSYKFRDIKNGAEAFAKIIRDLPKGEVLPIRVLMLPSWGWSKITELISDNPLLQVFSEVEVLGISGPIQMAPMLPPVASMINQIYPRLTFLAIEFNRFNDSFYKFDPVHFSVLTTLILSITNLGSFSNIKHWELPVLKHLEITNSDVTLRASEAVYGYLEKGWPKLISLRLNFEESMIIIPPKIWEWVPSLRYLGMSTIRRSPVTVPPTGHPIEVMANLEDSSCTLSRISLVTYVMRWRNVKVVADSHRWEDISPTILREDTPFTGYFNHSHVGPFCHLCILDVHKYCTSRGWRYEDRSGRSLGEVFG